MLLLLSGIRENGTFDQRILRNVKKTLVEKEITLDQPVWRLFELASKGKQEQVITPQQREQFVQRNPVPADIGRFLFWFVAAVWLVDIAKYSNLIDFSFAEIITEDGMIFVPILFIASYTLRSLRASKITELRRQQQNRPDPIPYPYHKTTISEGNEILNLFIHWASSLYLTFVFIAILASDGEHIYGEFFYRIGLYSSFVLYVLLTQTIHNSHQILLMWRRFISLNVLFIGIAYYMFNQHSDFQDILLPWLVMMLFVFLLYLGNKQSMMKKYSAMVRHTQGGI